MISIAWFKCEKIRDCGSSPYFWDAWVFLGMSNNAQRVTLTCVSARDVRAHARRCGHAGRGSGHLGTVNPLLHVSFSNCWPSSLLRKQTCYVALPKKWTEQKRVRIKRYKKSCRFKEDFWAAVQPAGCFISMCIIKHQLPSQQHVLWYMLLRRQLVLRTLKWSIQPVAPQLKSSFWICKIFCILWS